MTAPAALKAVPKLAELLECPERVSDLPVEAVPAILGDLERLKAALWYRLTAPRDGARNGSGDRLLTMEQAAAKLAVSRDWLYHHHPELPFTVRAGAKVLFSELLMDRWIRQRAGR